MRIVLLQPYFLHRALAAVVGEGYHIDARGEGGSGDRDLARFTVEVFAPHQSAGGVDEFGQAVAAARQGYYQSIGCTGDAQGISFCRTNRRCTRLNNVEPVVDIVLIIKLVIDTLVIEFVTTLCAAIGVKGV